MFQPFEVFEYYIDKLSEILAEKSKALLKDVNKKNYIVIFLLYHGQIFFTEKHRAGFSHGRETTAREKVRPASPVEIVYAPISKVVSRQ